MAKSLNKGTASDASQLVDLLSQLEDKDILPIVRAFNQFLNLANIADLEYFSSADAQDNDGLDTLLTKLSSDVGKDQLYDLMSTLRIDLVLTAHPTEVTRRTLIRKYEKIARTLSDLTRGDLLTYESNKLQGRLHRLVEEVWNTNEIRDERPTAVDEAKWGFAVIENSLWHAVPDFIRHFDRLSRRRLGQALPLDLQPFKFYSWMGGDRDGNPNVTHKVTEEVIMLGRWKAADLYLQDLYELGGDLSMHEASDELLANLPNGASPTPYRERLHALRKRLEVTLDWTERTLAGENLPEPENAIHHRDDLLKPLLDIHSSLIESGFEHIANGPISDTLRRIYAFGISLAPLDIRQDSDRHVQVLDELTNYLEMGSYREWDEEKRQAFLLEQLNSSFSNV